VVRRQELLQAPTLVPSLLHTMEQDRMVSLGGYGGRVSQRKGSWTEHRYVLKYWRKEAVMRSLVGILRGDTLLRCS
jgi:hypothetical protein